LKSGCTAEQVKTFLSRILDNLEPRKAKDCPMQSWKEIDG
jgi:hypothetical protein